MTASAPTTSSSAGSSTRNPPWITVAAGLGVVWNVYGVYQFVGSLANPAGDSMRAGMTPHQAALYDSLPGWITLAFAVGVFGGLAGSVTLLARRAIALPIFAASFVGYVLLFAGDVHYGVFAAIPTQLAILTLVVAIAAALLGVALLARRRDLLVHRAGEPA